MPRTAQRPGRARDSAELPEQMRRDVRLLGELLGEVISESGGQDLLDDVERLRQGGDRARGRRGRAADRPATRSPPWSPLAAGPRRAGGPGLHRLLPPGQPGRGAAARPHPAASGTPSARPLPRVAGRRGGADRRRAGRRRGSPSCSPGCACTRCSPRTRPRRAAARSSPRCGGSAALLDRRSTTRGRGAARAGRGPAAAARGDRPAVADRAAAGYAELRPARRGPHRDGRVRRDAVPGRAARSTGRSTTRSPARQRHAAAPLAPAVHPVRQLGRRRPGRQPQRDRRGDPGGRG